MSSTGPIENGEAAFRRYLEGDESAFKEVLEAYFPSLTLFVCGIVHDYHSAEDIAIDTMTELVARPERFGFRSSLKTWLFAVARHKALNRLRRQRRIAFTPLDENAADERSLEDEVIRTDEGKRLHAAISGLPPEMRTAVHLVYIEGMSYAEAAGVMKKNRKQVDNLLSRAKTLLQAAMGGEEGL
ncbi:MAG: RNA polymerase sigma factor [Clostridia bacterium]|nr:RNA polymerase sigma factor [Clostridia bacterium]